MKKKTKLLGTLTALCASLCMMIIGVLAASQVGLNVSSSVSFEAKGVYVKVKGEVLKGNDTTEPTRAEEPEGSDYYYIGYSYDAVTEQTETGETATVYDDTPVGTLSNSTIEEWQIGTVEFDETNKIIQYNFTFINYSEFYVDATITNYSILTTLFDGVAVNIEEDSTNGVIKIPALTGETPGTATFTITLTLNNLGSSFNKQVPLKFNFQKGQVPVIKEYFTYNTTAGEITGMSETYLNLETKPDTIVIPSTAPDGTKITKIADSNEWDSGDFPYPVLDLSSKNIIIEEGIEEIGYGAFARQNLKTVNFPSSVTTIGSEAFSYANVETITFNDNSRLTNFSWMGSNSVKHVNFGQNSQLKILNDTFLYSDSLESVILPDNLETIGERAFESCSNLTSIKIPSSVTSIGKKAFYDCGSLQIIVDPSNTNYSSDNGSLYNKAQTELIKGAGGVPNVNILNTVTKICDNAFYRCNSLITVSLPEGVTSIGNNAFINCSSLSSITIPEGVTNIGSSAFYRCSSFTSITIPNSVKSIGDEAFAFCENLTEINFNATQMDDLTYTSHVFRGVGSNGSGITVNIGSNVTKIPAYLFENNANPAKIIIVKFAEDSKCKSIGYGAFSNCTSLTTIKIPESVTNIDDGAFSLCKSLNYNEYENGRYLGNDFNPHLLLLGTMNTTFMQFTINNDCKFIYSAAFDGCSSLTNITIPNGITSIGYFAFRDCSSLNSIEIPSSVTKIGSNAFDGCDSLTTLTFESPYNWEKAIGHNFTSNVTSNISLSNPSQNATWFKGTKGYFDYYWRKMA